MHRHAVGVVCVLAAAVAAAQTSPSASTSTSNDPTAVAFAQSAVTALTSGGKAAISDIQLNANVVSLRGTDNETGTANFEAKGTGESRVDLNLSGGSRSDVRNVSMPSGGAWQANGGQPNLYMAHNCLTDSAWFFPALSSLTRVGSQNLVLKYIGQEIHNGVNTQHIRVYQVFAQDPSGTQQRLSTMDFYLDVNTNLPLAVAFNAHPDTDANVDIPTEIRFANYQAISGVLIPFHFQKLLDGGVVLDATVSSAVVNSGLADTIFSLQ